MLSKCANPSCSTPFHYLRDGKLFQLDGRDRAWRPPDDKVIALSKPARRVEYFWLCSRCAAELTLAWDSKKGVITVPLSRSLPGYSAQAS